MTKEKNKQRDNQTIITGACFVILTIIMIFGMLTYSDREMEAKTRFNDLVYAFSDVNKSDLEQKMITGTVLMHESNHFINLFLAEYERGHLKDFKFNFSLMGFYVDSGLGKLYEAFNFYNQALKIASDFNYSKEIVEKMNNFDYGKIRNNFKNVQMFDFVTTYLKKCEIIELYKKNIEYVSQIIIKLNEINKKIKLKELPEVLEVQNIDELFLEVGYFGLYSTKIGNLIK